MGVMGESNELHVGTKDGVIKVRRDEEKKTNEELNKLIRRWEYLGSLHQDEDRQR